MENENKKTYVQCKNYRISMRLENCIMKDVNDHFDVIYDSLMDDILEEEVIFCIMEQKIILIGQKKYIGVNKGYNSLNKKN